MIDSASKKPLFPAITARSLSGRAYALPNDLGEVWNVLLLVFERQQQPLAESWLPFLEGLAASTNSIQFYELAIVSHAYTLARPFIDGRIHSAVADQRVRDRTLTVYLDVSWLTALLALPTTRLAVLLLDRCGRICWRGYGGYDTAQAATLERAVEKLLSRG